MVGLSFLVVPPQTLTNTLCTLKNGEQYKFAVNSKIWFPTMVGEYREGFWSFDIQKVIKK